MAKRGRKSEYTDALGALICERLADGMALAEICRSDDIPAPESTVRGWVIDNPAFAAMYARARDIGLDSEADKIVTVARDTELPPDRARIVVDAMKWRLSKMAPKRYGDRITQEHSGPGGGPIDSRVEVVFVSAPAAKDEEA